GQTTTEIRDFDTEMQRNKNVRVAEGQITAKSPITLPGNAYVTMTGKIGADYVQHAIDLYHAEHGRYPETTEEFVSQIMKPNNLELPQLPAYQQYANKPDTHELVVLEY